MNKKEQEIVFLISETTQPESRNIRMSSDKRTIIFDAKLTNSAKVTDNGNVFDKTMVMESIADEFVQSRLRAKGLYGEMDHPTRDNPERYVQVYNKFRSHRWNKFWWEGEQLWGECETAISQYGRELCEMISQGTIPAFSLRAAGKIVGPTRKMRLITYDLVFKPSDNDAWADMSTRKEAMYAESDREWAENLLAGQESTKAFLQGCKYDKIKGRFVEVDASLELIGESVCGFKPKEVFYDNNNKVLGFTSDNMRTAQKVSSALANELDSFFRG